MSQSSSRYSIGPGVMDMDNAQAFISQKEYEWKNRFWQNFSNKLNVASSFSLLRKMWNFQGTPSSCSLRRPVGLLRLWCIHLTCASLHISRISRHCCNFFGCVQISGMWISLQTWRKLFKGLFVMGPCHPVNLKVK